MNVTSSNGVARRIVGWMGGAALLLPLATSTKADTIAQGTLEFKDVKILKIEKAEEVPGKQAEQEIFYTNASGKESHRTINDKLRVNVPDEATLNTAEDAFAAGKWADAADAYQKSMRVSTKPWVKLYVTPRLLMSAEKSNRFDLAVGAWLVLVDQNPTAAASKKPALPADPKSAYVATAASQVESAGNSTKDSTKATTLLAYALELYRASGNDKKVNELAAALGRATIGTGRTAPEAVGALAASKLSLASLDVEKKDFKAATSKLAEIREAINDPAQQADWLWINAEAQAGIAGDTKDSAILQTLALEYMRVVAHFPANKRAAEALLRTAALYEKIGDATSALNLYSQVARDFNDQPTGAEAKKSVQRLKAANPG